ncbi:hypothetical protein V6N12_056221 [Hibiscus sabdariffa]|uniref:Uncharacterized protein n=1 Tax=Hibiscus sabdariffa TaxID=183260 RepID=A0ABR2CRX6_9ROSI
MAATQQKTRPCCISQTNDSNKQNWSPAVGSGSGPSEGSVPKTAFMALIRLAETIEDPPATKITPSKGISIMTRAQTCHPLDPLSVAEISVAVATMRAAGTTPDMHISFLLSSQPSLVITPSEEARTCDSEVPTRQAYGLFNCRKFTLQLNETTSDCLPLAGSEHNLWVTPYAPQKCLKRTARLLVEESNPGSCISSQFSLHFSLAVLEYRKGLTHLGPHHGASHYTPTLAPHSSFNCSPAINVPPSASDLELNDDIATKPIQNGTITKL